MAEPARYVVVVHGIGEQRNGETLLPVVQRVAEARRLPRRAVALGNPLTLPALVAASGNGYGEFAGIPRRRPAQLLDGAWLPRPAEPAVGDNLRFVDLCWADLPRRDFPLVGQDFAAWSAGLIERLEHAGPERGWVRDLLKHLRRGLVPVQALLALRARSTAKIVFDEFLGDVQLYAEYAPVRGAAVRRFHEVMAALDSRHSGEPPRYTVIAHSLGTVLTLDALAMAHAGAASRASSRAADGIWHLPGYRGTTELPDTGWARRVDALVTLGSPIDKFLLLWPEAFAAYEHTDWLDAAFLGSRAAPIRHVNYCDEQDPVGHELDLLRATPVAQRLLQSVEEQVYARYVLPGVAHVGYWRDDALFRRIVDIAIDDREPAAATPVRWFRNRAFCGVLLVTYVAVPATGWLLATIACAFQLQALDRTPAPDYAGALWYLVLCSLTVAATLWLSHLMVMWRQVLHLKRARPVSSPARTAWRLLFRTLIFGTPPLWTVAAWHCAHCDTWHGDPLPRAATILATIVSSSLLLSYLTVRGNWRRLRRRPAPQR